jgi:putative phosphoribosyl transferase
MDMLMNDSLFKDREDAGKQLALSLEEYKDKNALVLGIPRGGVEVGYYIAKELNAELSVIITKKIPHPQHPEFGIGSICEEGTVYMDQETVIPENILLPIIKGLKDEINRRILAYRDGKPIPEMKDRVVIIVDDGIATGVTLVAAILLCKKHKPAKIVVAVPVSGKNFAPEIKRADELVILYQPSYFVGVGQAYEDFSQLTDEQVLSFLKKDKLASHNKF